MTVATQKGSIEMSTTRFLATAGALVLSAVLGGTLMSVAMAAQPAAAPAAAGSTTSSAATPSAPGTTAAAAAASAPAAKAGAAATYCATFRADFAANLGVTEAAVGAAARAAAASAIDAAVKDGELTAAAGDRLKARVLAADQDLCTLVNGLRSKVARAALGIAQDALTAAADVLGMTPADLRADLRSGKDLASIASAKNVPLASVTSAVEAAVRKDLDAAVRAGTIKQAREDAIMDRLTKALADGRLRP